jgi:Flp pilus assembly protein TadD
MSNGPLRATRSLWTLCLLCGLFQCGAAAADPVAQKKATDLFEQAGRSFAASQYAGAAAELIQSLRLDPQQPRAAKMLGVCYQLLGDLRQAEASFVNASRLDGDDPQSWFFLGRVYYLEHSFDNARKALQSASRLNSQDPQVHELLALTSETIGDVNGALTEFVEAVRWNKSMPKPLSTPHLSYGVFLHKLNRLEESEKQLRIATGLNPKDSMAHFELGKLLFDLDRFEAAVQELTVASQTAKPRSEDAIRAYRLLGRTYYRMGRDHDARSAMAMASK